MNQPEKYEAVAGSAGEIILKMLSDKHGCISQCRTGAMSADSWDCLCFQLLDSSILFSSQLDKRTLVISFRFFSDLVLRNFYSEEVCSVSLFNTKYNKLSLVINAHLRLVAGDKDSQQILSNLIDKRD